MLLLLRKPAPAGQQRLFLARQPTAPIRALCARTPPPDTHHHNQPRNRHPAARFITNNYPLRYLMNEVDEKDRLHPVALPAFPSTAPTGHVRRQVRWLATCSVALQVLAWISSCTAPMPIGNQPIARCCPQIHPRPRQEAAAQAAALSEAANAMAAQMAAMEGYAAQHGGSCVLALGCCWCCRAALRVLVRMHGFSSLDPTTNTQTINQQATPRPRPRTWLACSMEQ